MPGMDQRYASTGEHPWWFQPGSPRFLLRMALGASMLAPLNGLFVLLPLIGPWKASLWTWLSQLPLTIVFTAMAITYWGSYRRLRRGSEESG